MKKVEIILKGPEDGKRFCEAANKFVDDVDLDCGSIVLDGKSIMGMYYLSYPCKATAVLYNDNVEVVRLFDDMMDAFSPDAE